MQKILSLEKNRWLEEAISWENDSKPLRVSNFLPKFDNYFGITWKVGIIESFPFKDFVYDAKSENEIKINRKIWNKFPQAFDDSESGYTEISTQELFKKFEITYHDYKNDNQLPWNTRAIKVLESKIIESLSKVLNNVPETESLNLYWEDYYRFDKEDRLFSITKEEFLNELINSSFDSSVYLYPESKNWCLVNLEDLGFNILAFNNNIKHQMRFLSEIENFELTEESELFRY